MHLDPPTGRWEQHFEIVAQAGGDGGSGAERIRTTGESYGTAHYGSTALSLMMGRLTRSERLRSAIKTAVIPVDKSR